MKKLLVVLLFGVMAVMFGAPSWAQDHLLMTEFVVSPTNGEFVEIYNPTADSVDLTNYYITDATFAGGGTYYYNVVTGTNAGGGTFADFNAKFPAGAKIPPHAYQTVSFAGSTKFNTVYGVAPTYELFEDDAAADTIPDMLEATDGSINKQGGLSNDGEVLILYFWDGMSDLVQDVDYVVWGDKVEAVNKTGVKIDGPDADADSSTYLADTPIADQFVVNTDQDADGNPHDDGKSAQRKLGVEDLENWLEGNGITGHNETSENTSWMGGIWSLNTTPTPNAPALGDGLSIPEIQFVRADSIGPTANDNSKYVNDTLTVTGIMMQGPRELYLGARWGGFIQEEHGGPWSGFFIIQNDSTVAGTLLSAAQPGDKIKIKGVLQEYPTTANTQSISQFVLFTNPVEPIEFIDFGLPLPDPVLLKPGDLGATGTSVDPQKTERWESVLVRFEGLTVTRNIAGQPGNMMLAGDETGTIAIDDYFLVLRTYLDSHQGVWPGVPTGTKINVTGFLRDGVTGGVSLNPRSMADIEIAVSPPEIKNITRDPAAPTSSQSVNVSAVIVDAQTAVAVAEVHYRVNGGAYQTVAMTTPDSTFTGVIPAQADGALIEYFLTAVDETSDSTMAPGDTSTFRYFYFVRDAGLKIYDLQYTPFANGNSAFTGLTVTVSGVVTTDSADFSYYWIQDGVEPWNGIWVNDNLNNVKMGDLVNVTGKVNEYYNVTEIYPVTNVTIVSHGNPVPAPILVKTGEIMTGAPTAEPLEGMLVRVEKAVVTVEFPDSPGNYGEFTIDDGSGPVRVDDEGAIRGNLDSVWVVGDSLSSITGVLHYTFSNFKIEPRNDNDVVRLISDVENQKSIPLAFNLVQNYPNPFNPTTSIDYEVAKRGVVTIAIYNMLGQRIKTLVDEVKPAGRYSIRWNGTNDNGLAVSSGLYFYQMKAPDYQKTLKMLFMK